MTLSRALILLSLVVFAFIGIAYVVAPGAMLAIVGIDSGPTSDFLLRTEGVLFLGAAGVLWAVRDARPTQATIVLAALGLYYILSSLVDLSAYAGGVVGPASVASAAGRILIGALCLVAGLRLRPQG